MDTIAHALWTYLIFMRNKFWRLAVIFAIIPDLPLLLFIIYSFFKTGVFSLFVECTPFIYFLEESTHSLLIVLFIILILFFIFKKKVLFLFAWPLHIIIDIFTHSSSVYPTRFLFPFSDYVFNGLNWMNVYFIIINYTLLITIYYFVVKNARSNKNIKKTI